MDYKKTSLAGKFILLTNDRSIVETWQNKVLDEILCNYL